MITLSTGEAQKWCLDHGIALSPRGIPDLSWGVDFERFKIPSDAGQRVALVRADLQQFKDQTVLIWIGDYQVWPSGQWEHLFNQFRKSYGISDGLNVFPAQLIEPEDFDAAISLAVYSILMLWDCYIIPDSTDRLLFYSHDEYGLKRKS